MKKTLNLLTIAGILALSTGTSMAKISAEDAFFINEYGVSHSVVHGLDDIFKECPPYIIKSVADDIHFYKDLDEIKRKVRKLSQPLDSNTNKKDPESEPPIIKLLKAKIKLMCFTHGLEISDEVFDIFYDSNSCSDSKETRIAIECFLKEYSFYHLAKIEELNAYR